MARFYSSAYGPQVGETGHATTKASTPSPAPSSGAAGSRMRKKNPRITLPALTDMAADDEVRWCSIKSSDRIFEILYTADANMGATATYDWGLWLPGVDHDGAVVSRLLFYDGLDQAGALDRTDIFIGNALTTIDKGKRVWELLGLSEDPGLTYEIAMVADANETVVDAAVVGMLEVVYTDGS